MFSRLQEVNKKNLRDGDEEDFIKKKNVQGCITLKG
jgi:hypothetical protein